MHVQLLRIQMSREMLSEQAKSASHNKAARYPIKLWKYVRNCVPRERENENRLTDSHDARDVRSHARAARGMCRIPGARFLMKLRRYFRCAKCVIFGVCVCVCGRNLKMTPLALQENIKPVLMLTLNCMHEQRMVFLCQCN